MKRIIWIFVAIVVVTAGALVILEKGAVKNEGPVTFEGTVSAVDTSCFSDGICSITVDGKRVIIVIGGRRIDPLPEVGTLKGVESIGDAESHIGASAKVYAARTPEGDYTIYGSAEYYVEII